MKRVIDIKRAGEVKSGEVVLVPQSGMGILLAHEVTGTEQADGGKWVEIATDDGLKHLVGKEGLVVVVCSSKMKVKMSETDVSDDLERGQSS